LVHPDDLRDLRQRNAAGKSNKLLANGFPVVAWEARFRHRSGEWRWLSIREREFELNPDGIVRTIFGIAQDVTQRKQIEDALIESETRYREMIERIPAAIIIVDTETSSVTYRNQAASDLLEETPDFTVLDALKLLYEHYMPVFDERFDQVTQGYSAPPREYHLQLPSGRARYVTSQSTPITYEGGRALMIVLVDTTERRQMEKERVERERLEASLQKEQELNALKSSMMLRISHEFRTPLSVIQLASETINRYATRLTPQKRQELVHRIATQIQQLVGMLEEMAFIVKNQSAPLMPHTMRFNLIELCYEIINRIHDSVLMRSPIHFSAEDTYIVLADPKLIQMLLLHLLTNAVKFSTNGSPVQFSIRAYDSMVEMRVADEGIGISAADQQRIFEPFFRGGNISEISGMGLGLSIALEIVKAHGGTLQVESTLNQGSVFTVALPILADV
jgi:PAS domain S-box-containing protein